MTLDEKINQINEWEEKGLISDENIEKLNKIFDIFENAKDIIEDVKAKKTYCEEYLKSLESVEKDQIKKIQNTFAHFNSTYELIKSELTEEVENTDKNKITKDQFLEIMQALFNKCQ